MSRSAPAFVSKGGTAVGLTSMRCSDSSIRSVEPTGPPKFLCASFHAYHALLTPADPPEPHLWRFLRVGFWTPDAIAICSIFINEAVSCFGECGLPYGLRDPCVRFNCYVRVIAFPPRSCNTWYEWLVRPFSAGTCTLRKAPGFAWRTGCKNLAQW
jgi:hypothetical protein